MQLLLKSTSYLFWNQKPTPSMIMISNLNRDQSQTGSISVHSAKKKKTTNSLWDTEKKKTISCQPGHLFYHTNINISLVRTTKRINKHEININAQINDWNNKLAYEFILMTCTVIYKIIDCTDVRARQITAVPVQNKKIDPMQNCHILISSLSEWMRCSTWNEIRMNCIPSSMNSRSGLFHSVFSFWTCSSKLDFFLLFQFVDYTVPNWSFPYWI